MKKIFLLFVVCILSCKKDKQVDGDAPINAGQQINLKYAKGFTISKHKNYTVLEIHKPWPKAEKSYKYFLLKKGANIDWEETENVALQTPLKKIVVTSTTHLPALELLKESETLVGFPGCDYISSSAIRKQILNGNIRELGKNEGINIEVLLELKPDVVIGFGVDGVNKTFETIKKSGIPIIYNGDWVEGSALAKAEWIKFFGVLYNKEKQADSIFNVIEKNYNTAKEIASQVESIPTVLSGAMHKDVWYLPSGTSPEAQLLKDANVNYLWQNTTSKGSLALSYEAVFNKGKDANIWISPSYYSSYEALEKANSHYTQFEAFKSKNIFSFSNTTGETGGVLYYELGTARPDLVLKDIIKICHPKLLQNYKTTFFKPLN